MTDVTGQTVASARRRAPVPPYPDLESAWLAELASAPGPGLPHQLHVRGTGRHGWLHECGAVASLAPLFPGPVDLEGGIASFRDLGGPVATRLLEVLPEGFLATERQNDGPTIGAVLRAVAANPDEVVAHGYLVSPRRCDERLTVEGVLLRSPRDLRVFRTHDDGCECDELVSRAQALGIDDARCRPHEITPWLKTEGEDPWWRLWWD